MELVQTDQIPILNFLIRNPRSLHNPSSKEKMIPDFKKHRTLANSVKTRNMWHQSIIRLWQFQAIRYLVNHLHQEKRVRLIKTSLINPTCQSNRIISVLAVWHLPTWTVGCIFCWQRSHHDLGFLEYYFQVSTRAYYAQMWAYGYKKIKVMGIFLPWFFFFDWRKDGKFTS
jgi:hypothetical protein